MRRSGWILFAALVLPAAPAQAQHPVSGTVTGRVLDAAGAPLRDVMVRVEGLDVAAETDSAGRYALRLPAGSHVLRTERIGYAVARVRVEVVAGGTTTVDLRVATRPLEMETLMVTADPVSRARGELGTATVIEAEAIRNQGAVSLAGVLELVPGVPLSPPGLDGVQQIALRASPVSSGAQGAANASLTDLASFGTLIILDGVPVSNNANLQTLGPRGEQSLATSANGGIDLRRIPATLIERVEVIRGIPSARYGELTQGAIIVDTRAGAVAPEVTARLDQNTTAASVVGGARSDRLGIATALFDIARTVAQPGQRDDHAYRLAGGIAHRHASGSSGDAPRFTLDTRIDYYQVLEDIPEDPAVTNRFARRSRDSGLRASGRARLNPGATRLELTAAASRQQQRSFVQSLRLRGAQPFTDRLDEGRAIGRYVGGQYLARADVDGDPWLLYSRLEAAGDGALAGFGHDWRAGTELRREWNDGRGYYFDPEFPPQVSFNGVQGYDRPRRYDDVPALATTAVYIDDRVSRPFGRALLTLQAGLRADVLHEGGTWLSGARDVVLQPRLNAELAPVPWLRLRGGAGRTAKLPPLAALHPAPQYNDLVNVNYYANDPAERLAVITTFVTDPTNSDLGYTTTDKLELGLEIGARGAALSLVAFSDRLRGGAAYLRTPSFLVRDHYDLTNDTPGSGVPPTIVEPPSAQDTVPILIDRPANDLALDTEGLELTATLPRIPFTRTHVQVQAALLRSRMNTAGLQTGSTFTTLQLGTTLARVPYWLGVERTGERGLATYRLIHHQPEVGLVATFTLQHTFHEVVENVGATDSLSFTGYITRRGELVEVPESRRGDPEFADLHQRRPGLLTGKRTTPGDWLLSLQVQKTLPLNGTLAFQAFNALDRTGLFSDAPDRGSRVFPGMRYGVELFLPLNGLAPW